jgi:hypothetical protein
MKFVKNTKYYTGTVYEWNLPTGHTCPFALECLVKVDRETGKFENKSNAYRCYAASPERFPAVRNHRWANYEYVLKSNKPVLPKDCKAVRIHAAGDFFNQAYFDMWIEIANENPDVEFWAYTKSLKYWVNRINDIPANLVLTASAGGRNDELIDQYKLKHVQVVKDEKLAPAELVDTNDDLARIPELNFYLIDNFKK